RRAAKSILSKADRSKTKYERFSEAATISRIKIVEAISIWNTSLESVMMHNIIVGMDEFFTSGRDRRGHCVFGNRTVSFVYGGNLAIDGRRTAVPVRSIHGSCRLR